MNSDPYYYLNARTVNSGPYYYLNARTVNSDPYYYLNAATAPPAAAAIKPESLSQRLPPHLG